MSPRPAPDVSVLIPTYRRPATLAEAVRSALAQRLVTVEVVVLDDCPDGSARDAIAAIGDPRVTYARMEIPSRGRPAAVRNAAWPRARGRFVHFLDDDDLVADGAYAALVAALEDRPGVGVAFGRVEPFGDDPGVLRQQRAYFADAARRARRAHLLRSRRVNVTTMLFQPTVLVCSACMIRREHVGALGGWRVDLPVVEDVDFYLRAIRRFGSAFLDRTVVRYRTGAPSLMHDLESNAKVEQAYRSMFDAYRRDHGAIELQALRIAARTALRWL